MLSLGWLLVGAGLGLGFYAYAGYPAALWLLGRFAPRRGVEPQLGDWPLVTVTLPVHNEEHNVAEVLDRILASDYPKDKLQVLVVSDASTDRTDDIVRGYADRQVELARLDQRRGKTAAENASRCYVRGEIIVNTDASVRIHPEAIRRLAAAFSDPRVGVASGRDVSVTRADQEQTSGESGYVGYEMWVRDLETRVSGIVGASGCLFANRSDLHRHLVPEALSRDFAAPLIAREQGYRSVSVNEALCYVPRTASLRREYKRKLRTMTRGMETLYFQRHLLNPFRHGLFAWMLFSHKVCRWLVPWGGLALLLGLALLSVFEPLARWVLGLAVVGLLVAVIGWFWPQGKKMPRLLSMPTFAFFANFAALHSTIKALSGDLNPIWEPTRREAGTPVAKRAISEE
jgi:cellulose synthase/poly-beta-1,6-N-acetylglucosamine synthase-like glycosyltransferase